MSWFHQFSIANMVLAFLFLPQSIVGASFPDDETSIASQFIDAWQKRRELELEEEFYRSDNARLAPKFLNPETIPGWGDLPAAVQRDVLSVVTDNVKSTRRSLQSRAEEHEKRIESLTDDWKKIRTQRDQKQVELADTIANRNSSVKLASLLGVDNRWFWVFALIAFFALATISWHNRRQGFRRQLNGGRAKQLGLAKLLLWAVVVFAIITLVVFLLGDRIYAAMVARANPKEVTVVELQAELVGEQQKLESAQQTQIPQFELWQKNVAKWSNSAPGGAPNDWEQLRTDLRDNFVQSQLRSELATKLVSDNILLERVSAKRNELLGEIGKYRTTRQILRTALGAVLTLFVGGFTFVLLRRIKENTRRLADTCPQCLSIGRFEKSDTRSGSLVCRNSFEMNGQIVDCGFEIPGIYLRLPKLCFPTLGLPDTGKTHWLAMCFRELTLGNYPKNVQFEKVKADGTDEINNIVNEIVHDHMNPSPTQFFEHLRSPVVFNFADRDPWGKSNLLVNVFDYGGEVTQNDDHPLRTRALDADGYFFFVDPTKSSGEQSEALQLFRQDVRQLKKVTSGSALHVPVALCISKIDLLHESENPIGEQSIANFYRDLEAIDSSTPPMSLQNIEAKSELMQEMRELIWPSWQIENEINGLFGGRVKFFPLTPVGVGDGKELDFQDRVIEPYGVVEPFMWLLHMNGYQVLDR